MIGTRIGVAKLAQHVRDWLDPDGTLDESDRRHRDRGLSLRRRTDGSGTLTGELTAECAERLQVVFDALAAPKPDTNGALDLRDPTQRRHDALLDTLTLVQRAGQLPRTQGVAATIVVTMTTEQYLTGQGLARTAHGALVPAREALSWAGADHRILAAVLDQTHRRSVARSRPARCASGRPLAPHLADARAAWRPAALRASAHRVGGHQTRSPAFHAVDPHHQHDPRLQIPPPAVDPARLATTVDQRAHRLATTTLG